MDLKDNQAKIERICLNKFVLGTIRRGQFFYKSIEKGYRFNFDCYSVFSLNFLIFFFQGLHSNLYYLYLLIFTLHMDNRLLHVDLCPINTLLKSLGVAVRLNKYCSKITSSLMRLES